MMRLLSFNKIFTKLGSDMKKPDAITVLDDDNWRERIWPIPVSELLYVGLPLPGSSWIAASIPWIRYNKLHKFKCRLSVMALNLKRMVKASFFLLSPPCMCHVGWNLLWNDYFVNRFHP